MGLFDFLFGRREVEHREDELGTLQRVRGATRWTVEVALPGSPGVTAHVEMSGGDAGPDEQARRDAKKLLEIWEELLSGQVIVELLQLDSDAHDGAAAVDRSTVFDEYVLRDARLETIGSGALLEIGFDVRSDDSHILTLIFDEWKPRGFTFDG